MLPRWFCVSTNCTAATSVVTFAVDSVTVDPECTNGFSQPPENGHFLAVALRVDGDLA